MAEPKKAKGKTLAQKTRYLALAKAKTAGKRFPRAVIIAADTLACCRGKIIGKAKHRKEARAIIERLSGQRLDAVTSIAIAKPGGQDIVFWSEYGWVKFRKLEPAEITRYIRSGRWKGKAAAVNVEEKPVQAWIVKKGGEQGAVIGLPLKRIQKELRKCCDESR